MSDKERRYREKLRKKILKEAVPYEDGMLSFPGLGLRPGFTPDEHITVSIPSKLLEKVSEKIVRGSEFKLANGRLILYPYKVEIYFPREESIRFVTDIFETLPAQYLGPGFEVRRGISEVDPLTSLYRIVVWGQIKIYAAIAPDGYFRKLDMI